MFTLCVVKTSDDFIIVKDKYCEICLLKKLDIVAKYEITIEEKYSENNILSKVV